MRREFTAVIERDGDWYVTLDFGNGKATADLASQLVCNLGMSRHGFHLTRAGVAPERMRRRFPNAIQHHRLAGHRCARRDVT